MSIQNIIDQPVDTNLKNVTVALVQLGDLKHGRNANVQFYKATVAYAQPGRPSHQIDLMIWDGDQLDPQIVSKPSQLINLGSLRITNYQDTKNYSTSAKQITPEPSQTHQAYLNMIPHSYWKQAELTKQFKFYLDRIGNQNYKDLVNETYRKVNNELKTHGINLFEMPAAVSMHHAFAGGLVTHTVSMLKIAQSILDNTIYQKYFNYDLIYSGILLHDLGKALCYTNPFDHQESIDGTLFDHIAIIDALLGESAQHVYHQSELELLHNEEYIKLRQVILSHHGKLEWGSPTTPKLPEAIFVHYVDNVDAHLEMVREILDDPQLDKQEFTSKIFGLDNTKLWLPDKQ